MEKSKEQQKKDIQTRLRRIEGQVKGIEKMIENDSCCREVLIQVAAIRSAINKVGGLILQNYTKNCVKDEDCDPQYDKVIDELIATFNMFLK